jgi:hypothetical protein
VREIAKAIVYVAEREWMIKKRERIEEEKGTAAVPGRGHVQQ